MLTLVMSFCGIVSNTSRIVQRTSNLGTGHTATPVGRSTHSCCAQLFNVFSRWCQCAVYDSLIHPTYHSILQLEQFLYFCTDDAFSPYVKFSHTISQSIFHFPGASGSTRHHTKRHLDRLLRAVMELDLLVKSPCSKVAMLND